MPLADVLGDAELLLESAVTGSWEIAVLRHRHVVETPDNRFV